MAKAIGAALLFALVAAIILGVYALFALGVAVLVSYVFGIDFGFWKAAASLILLSIVSSVMFGKAASFN